ncbi:hypothetical protein BT69DRAFT_1276281 [Atractiella rhizophila]|nr:hypothetical protein BT69DRAFT_1276281 [Atractiella rhizophila]
MSCSPSPSLISSTSPHHSCQATSEGNTGYAPITSHPRSPHYFNLAHAIDPLPVIGETNLNPTIAGRVRRNSSLKGAHELDHTSHHTSHLE